MKRSAPIATFSIVLLCIITGCQQQIEVDLPEVDPVYVVEGTIVEGEAPIVFVGEAVGYFDPVDANSIGQAFLAGASVHLSDGTTTVELDELCTSDLPPELLESAEEILGFPDTLLAELDLCVYTSFDPAWRGEDRQRAA